MSLLANNEVEKNGSKLPHLDLVKLIRPIILMIFMAANVSLYAQSDKKMNYGGLKDTLKTYLADCFIKEIFAQNSPEKIRSTLAYVSEHKELVGDDALAYIVGDLLDRKKADNIVACQRQDTSYSVTPQDLSKMNTPLPNDTTSGKSETVVDEKKQDELVVDEEKKDEPVVDEEKKNKPVVDEKKKNEAIVKEEDCPTIKHDKKSDQGSGEPLYNCEYPHKTAEDYGWNRIADCNELAKLAAQHGYLSKTEEYTGTAEQNIHIQKMIVDKKLYKNK